MLEAQNANTPHLYSKTTQSIRRNKRWSLIDDAHLSTLYPTRIAAQTIAHDLGRTVNAIRSRAKKLGLRRGRGQKIGARILQRNGSVKSVDYTRVHDTTWHEFSLIKRANGSVLWTNNTVFMLSKLWKRLYSAEYIAQLFDIKPNAVREAARRAGLPGRHGVGLIHQSQYSDPLQEPINTVIDAQMVETACTVSGKPFFVKSKKEKATQRYSLMSRRRIMKNILSEDDLFMCAGSASSAFASSSFGGW